MKRCTVLIVLFLLLTACSPSSVNTLRTREFTWQPFEWISSESGGIRYEKYAIAVPIQFEGLDRKFWLQLDTAAYSQMDGITFDNLSIQHKVVQHKEGYKIVEFNAKITGYDTGKAWFPVMANQGSAEPESSIDRPIGTLGIDFFQDKILVLDFPRKRLGIATKPEQLPKELVDSAKFIPATMTGNWFMIKPTVGEKTLNVGFDTGTSLCPLSVDKGLWERLTGRSGDESDNKKIEGSAWGKPITLVGAPTIEQVFLGELLLGYPHAYFEASRTVVFVGSPVDGVMGNAPFCDRYIVILDCIGKRFGLVDTQSP